jgi:hypothetical protein
VSSFPDNDVKFTQLRALNLPLGHYAVACSGPLGIRDLRAIGDIDLIVDDQLWERLATHHPVTRDDGFDRIRIGPTIEIFGPDSFLASRTASPTVFEQIATSELIAGLPFVRLGHVLHFKKRILARPKDLADIRTIEKLPNLIR